MKESKKTSSFLLNYAKQLVRFRWIGLVLLISLTSFLGYQATSLPDQLGGDGFSMDGEFDKAQKILSENFKVSQENLIVLVENTNLSTKAFQEKIKTVSDTLQKEKNIETYLDPLVNKNMLKDKAAYFVLLYKQTDPNDLYTVHQNVETTLAKLNIDGVKIGAFSKALISKEMNETSQHDLERAEMIGLPIAFLVLLFAFRSLVASLIPIVIGGLTIVTTFGLLTYVSHFHTLSVFVLNVAPMIGLSLSIDFCLFFISRYREESEKQSLVAALAKTFQTAGKSIIFSGICVLIGLFALVIIKVDLFQSVAISSALVVAVAMFYSVTLLPILLAVLGKFINAGSFFKQKETKDNIWRNFARQVMKRPVVTLICTLLILLISVIPIKQLTLVMAGNDILPKSSSYRIAAEQFDKFFPENGSIYGKVQVVLETKNKDWTKENLQQATNWINTLKKDNEVHSVSSLFSVLKDVPTEQLAAMIKQPPTPQLQQAVTMFVHENQQQLTIQLKDKGGSKITRTWIEEQEKIWKKNPDFTFHIGGDVKFQQELFDEILSNFKYSILLVLGSTLIILLFAFQSVLLPIKALLMNGLGLGATFGLLTMLFENGLMGLPQSHLIVIIPVFVFGLVFGMSMDYEVFLVSRIKEIYDETGDNDYSTLEGLVSTSRIITSAASIMIVVTGAFAFTDLIPVKQMGIGIALAIFLDATVIRLLLVPSLMKLLGDWNWWLPFKKKKSLEQENTLTQDGA